MEPGLDLLADRAQPRPDAEAVEHVLFAIIQGMVDAAGTSGERDAKALATRVGVAVFGYVESFGGPPARLRSRA